jgi:hypothetical protein
MRVHSAEFEFAPLIAVAVVRAEDHQPDDALHPEADSLLVAGRQHERRAKWGRRPTAAATAIAPGRGGRRPVAVRRRPHRANTCQEAKDRAQCSYDASASGDAISMQQHALSQ